MPSECAVPLTVGLLGGHGRMGQAIQTVVKEHPFQWRIVQPLYLRDAGLDALRHTFFQADVVIDFSHHLFLPESLRMALEMKKPFVICTTGHEQSPQDLYVDLKGESPVVYAPNVSLSVLRLANCVASLCHALGPSWDVHLSDHHHRHKKDSPSGTALMMGQTITKQCAWLEGKIDFSAVRGGSFCIQNKVILSGDNEVIEISHQAFDRAVFAQGALELARWICTKEKGFYHGEDRIKESI